MKPGIEAQGESQQAGPAPLLVGELNPHGSDPRHALFPYPRSGSGGRLCFRVFGMRRLDYLERFERVNLCTGKWDSKKARLTAGLIDGIGRDRIVLLGAKVAEAFGYASSDYFKVRERIFFESGGRRRSIRYVVLPHPSGRCRVWNDRLSVARARRAMKKAGVDLS